MNALSKQEIAELREGDIVYVRMEVRKPIGEFGTVHCRIHSEDTWRSHYVPVFPEHIVGRVQGVKISEIPEGARVEPDASFPQPR
jgi:hypothetical protein